MKILLIEDDKEISKMLRSYLMTENFEVVCASDGQMACEAFDTDTYSIVLLDLMIPKLTGMDVMKHIRKKSTVPIIIISAKDSDSDKTLGLGLGADDYITKSGKIVELTAKEFDILRLLLEHPQKVYTKAQLYSMVWNDAYMGDENAVNVHISRLRNKIEDDPRKPQTVVTVWGIGYKLGASV